MSKECLGKMFFHIAHHAWENQEELKFSDSDVKKIMGLKIEAKKMWLKDRAEMESIGLDIMASLWAETPDAGAINKLIDKKMDIKREGVKKFIQAFIELKKMFSKDQMKTLKAICMRQQCGKEMQKEQQKSCNC